MKIDIPEITRPIIDNGLLLKLYHALLSASRLGDGLEGLGLDMFLLLNLKLSNILTTKANPEKILMTTHLSLSTLFWDPGMLL